MIGIEVIFLGEAVIVKNIKLLVKVLVVLVSISTVNAAVVTWSSELLLPDGSNVVSEGIEHVGVSYGSSSGDSRIINGVNFKANDTVGNHDNGGWYGWIDNRNGSSTRYGAAGTDLKELTNDIVYGRSLVLGINNLTVGHTYRIQLISYDADNWWNRPEAAIERWQTIMASGDMAFSFQHGTESPYAGIDSVGGTLVIGTWKADAPEIEFTINGLVGSAGNINDNAIINGFVVQDLTPTPCPEPSCIKGYNWSDTRDNFIDTLVRPSGIYDGITDAQIDALGERVCNALTGDGCGNTIRFGINPTTVADTYWWGRYQRLIGRCQSKGLFIILCCWDSRTGNDGKIDNYSQWQTMWETLDDAYVNDDTVFFEPFNEPYGYSKNEWLNIVQDFRDFTDKPENRILISGTGYSERVAAIGGDSRVGNCWLSLHIYSWWGSFQNEWMWKLAFDYGVGSYAYKTVLTEFGAPATTGKDYGTPSSDFEVCFIRAVCWKLNDLNMGCCYWPGIRDRDSYRLFTTEASPEVTNWSLARELRGAFGYNDGDIDLDNDVDVDDLVLMAGHWLAANGEDPGWADTDGDGMVQMNDYANMARNWLVGTDKQIGD